MASFSKIEVGQPVAQWPANFGSLKAPELCQNQADRLQSQVDIEKHPDRREYLRMVKEVSGKFVYNILIFDGLGLYQSDGN